MELINRRRTFEGELRPLASLARDINFDRDKLEATLPGALIRYDEEKKKSSEISLATSSGIIKKSKRRSPGKAIYEFLCLEVWHDLLENYSLAADNLRFMSPKPLGVTDLDLEKPAVLMEFMPGYSLKRLGSMKRSTPVKIKGQTFPLPVYPACALHLGALDRIKEEEDLLHGDYAARHVMFSPLENVGIGVIDVENSRVEPVTELIDAERDFIFGRFKGLASSPKDRDAIGAWYQQGADNLVIPEDSKRVRAVIDAIQKKYNVEFDMTNKKVNGVYVG